MKIRSETSLKHSEVIEGCRRSWELPWKFSLIKFTKNWNCSRTQLKKHIFEKPVEGFQRGRLQARKQERGMQPGLPSIATARDFEGFSFKNKPSSRRRVSKREQQLWVFFKRKKPYSLHA